MKRPRGVTIISYLLLLQGLVGILFGGALAAVGVLALANQLPTQVLASLGTTSASDWVLVGAYILIALLAFAGGVALLLMRPWGWAVAMLLQGYTLALNLWTYFQGRPLFLEMVLGVVIVFYLNTRGVYQAFEARRRSTNPAAAPFPSAPSSSAPHDVLEATDASTFGASAEGRTREMSETRVESGSRGADPLTLRTSPYQAVPRMVGTASMTSDSSLRLASDDIALLRRFEPILCFNRGEQFYPMNADLYLAKASLWARGPDTAPQMVVERGHVDDATLIRYSDKPDDVPGTVYYLSFADPASLEARRTFRASSTLQEFRPGPGRLMRVGLLARFLDLFFTLKLLLSGNAPGGLAVGAALRYRAIEKEQATQEGGGKGGPWYHGRVVREHGYTALQYYFLYAYNDWRSSFHGVNDHEADWEMVTVYAAEDATGLLQPCWMACSAHLGAGDDLRRRWDDPDLERVGEHPLVYVGAGSHANYFFKGEYMPAVEAPFTRPITRAWTAARRLWARLGQGDIFRAPKEGINIPFVDYARGDGLRIGPAQSQSWQVCLLQATVETPAPVWLESYRGLWGLHSGDPTGGENAPSGPRFERGGGERRRWYDPVGWSGLDKTPPPAATRAILEQERQRLQAQGKELARAIDDKATQFMGLGLVDAAPRETFSKGEAARARRELEERERDLAQLKAEHAAVGVAIERIDASLNRLDAGDVGDPRAHLRAPDLPVSPGDMRLGRLAALWSAVSIGVLLVGLAILATFSPRILIPGALLLLGVYVLIDALFHRALESVVRAGAVVLALVTTAVLIVQFFVPLLLVLVLLVGVYILVTNVRELMS